MTATAAPAAAPIASGCGGQVAQRLGGPALAAGRGPFADGVAPIPTAPGCGPAPARCDGAA
jgi:hypothetical protein